MTALLRSILCCALSVSCAVAAWAADSFPTKPLRIVVPFGPGGVGDLTARAVAQKMTESLGQQVIIDNRPSAGGVVAAEMVAKAEPDGYTMLLLNNQQAVSVSLLKSISYDPVRDYQPVSTLGTFAFVILVSPDSPYRTLKELIAQAKANPGKLNVGTINIGATQHLSAELFKSMAGINAATIPYNNTGAVLAALRGHSVQFAVEVLAPVVGQIRAGSLRALGVTTTQRYPGLPDVPAVAEIVPGYQVVSWNGLAVPAKTPRARVDRLHQSITAALASAEVKQRFQDLGVEPRPSTPEAFQAHLKAEIAKWRKVIEEAKIPKQ